MWFSFSAHLITHVGMIYFKKIENYKKFLAYRFIYIKISQQTKMEGGQSGTYLRLTRASSGPWVSAAKTYRDETNRKWIFRPDHSRIQETTMVSNPDLPVAIHTQSHQIPFQECWSVSIIHKLPDSTQDHICRQFVTTYQLVLQSWHTPVSTSVNPPHPTLAQRH